MLVDIWALSHAAPALAGETQLSFGCSLVPVLVDG